MLYEYLKNNYKPNVPIFISDIDLSVTDVNLRQMFKVLCDSNKIKRFDNGIYYLPKVSRLKTDVPLDAATVAYYKYINKNNKIFGYYAGNTFANQIGISTQLPFVYEIVSNNSAAIVKEVRLNEQKIIIRKSRFEINKSNYLALQLLDLLKDIDKYIDINKEQAIKIVKSYIKKNKIKKKDVDIYIKGYPDKVYRNIYEMELFDVFA